jgi:hypothetical protein
MYLWCCVLRFWQQKKQRSGKRRNAKRRSHQFYYRVALNTQKEKKTKRGKTKSEKSGKKKNRSLNLMSKIPHSPEKTIVKKSAGINKINDINNSNNKRGSRGDNNNSSKIIIIIIPKKRLHNYKLQFERVPEIYKLASGFKN